MKKWFEARGIRICLYLIYILIGLFFLYPMIWILSLSLKTVPELFAIPPRLFPEHFNAENYLFVIKQTRILKNIVNSLYIVLFSVGGVLLITLPASYAFSRFRFRFNKVLMFGILIFQMISPLVIAVPLYRYFSRIGLINSHAALILVYIAISAPFATWYLKGYLDTIPRQLDEAATIDGCKRLQILYKIHIPVIVPGIISVALLVAVSCWSQFVVPFILLGDGDKFPISVGLINLQSTAEAVTTHYLAAACVLGILPTVIMFIVFQRFIVSAMTEGAVKG